MPHPLILLSRYMSRNVIKAERHVPKMATISSRCLLDRQRAAASLAYISFYSLSLALLSPYPPIVPYSSLEPYYSFGALCRCMPCGLLFEL